jgi:hypothetical protein
MRGSDPRSRKIAAVAESLFNAAGGPLAARREAIEAAGYGFLAMPPAGMAGEALARAIRLAVDQIEDYLASDYMVTLEAEAEPEAAWRVFLAEAMSARGLAMLKTIPAGLE